MDTQTLTVGVMADPGLPGKTAHSIAVDLSRDLTDDAGAGVRWEVDVSQGALPLTPMGRSRCWIMPKRCGTITAGTTWCT